MRRRWETWPLIGRREELALLDEESAGGRLCVVVAGGVGVGKSRLLAGWLDAAETQARPTIVVRATKATATIPFGAFARWIPEHLGDTSDRLGVMLAIAARLAEEASALILAVDDAQLLDDGSAALVLHLAQHTDVGLLVAVRSGEPCPDAVIALWKEGLATRLDLQPLSESQSVELLEHVLDGQVAPGTRRRLWHLTDGNPLYLLEVVETALAQGVLAPADGAWRWTGALAGATRLVGLVSDRLGACTPDERRMLELLALGEPLPVKVVAELAPPELLAELEVRQLVVVDRRERAPDAAVVRLTRPLDGEVLRNELPGFTARSHHRALADAGLRGGFHRHQPLRVATWVLESGGETGQPALLLRGSHVALQTDDYELSERLAAAAARAGGGWPARLRRAEALGPLRRWDEADALLDELSHGPDGPEARAAAAQVRAEQSFWHRGEDVGVARQIVADAAASVEPPLRSSLLMHAAWYAQMALELDESIRLATEAAAAADSLDDRLNGVGCVALAAAFQGRTSVALDLVRQAGGQAMRAVETAPMAGGYLAFAYSFASYLDGRMEEAVRFFTSYRSHDVARLAGTPGALSSAWLANAVLAQGRVATAAGLGREALGRFGDENHFGRGTWIAATLATAAAQSGDHEAAAAALAWIDGRRRPAVRADDLLADRARAWVRAGRGELSTGCDLALDVAGRARAAGAPMFEVLALLDTVRFGGAAVAAERLDELHGVVEGRLVAPIADFARSGASGDAEALDGVAARFGGMGAFLLAAEAATTAGAAHHERGRRRSAAASRAAAQRWLARCEGARTPLLAGLDAVPLATTLTRREREIAGLAAGGRTSRQIAEALTISIRTVDSHLNHAYTKLGINDRVELATALGRDDQR